MHMFTVTTGRITVKCFSNLRQQCRQQCDISIVCDNLFPSFEQSLEMALNSRFVRSNARTACGWVYFTGHCNLKLSTYVSQSLSSYQEQTADSELLKDTKNLTTEVKDSSASFGNVKKTGS